MREDNKMLHLICALKCEARAVIKEFKMAHYRHPTLFDTYVDPSGSLSLTISGIGKAKAAAAVIHTYMLFNENQNHGWLNYGIAGHAFHKPGTSLIATKVIDHATGNTWYPQLLFKPDCKYETLITIDKPSSDYQDNAMFDMEASGFYESVTKVSSLELCHSLKIISDNSSYEMKQINKVTVDRLIEQNMETISNITNEIGNLITVQQQGHYDKNTYFDLISRHHFTHTQKIQLIKLLKRWQILKTGDSDNFTHRRKFSSSTEILDFINSTLNESCYRL